MRSAIPSAVEGVICISPIAPEEETAVRPELRLLVDHRLEQSGVEPFGAGARAHDRGVVQRVAQPLVPGRARLDHVGGGADEDDGEHRGGEDEASHLLKSFTTDPTNSSNSATEPVLT